MAEKKSRSYAVRTSDIHGRGVFATKTIRGGTAIVEYKGQRTSYEKALRRSDSDPEDSAHTFLFELDDGRVIDAGVRGNAARWINHSCDPNCEPSEDAEGRIFIKAKRTIRDGEELSYNYRLNIEGRLTKRERAGYACRCGSAKCRGTLLDDSVDASG
jgi:SET domain-containing protein